MVLSGSYINKINKVSALRSSAGAVHVGHPYGTSERDSSCTTTSESGKGADTMVFAIFRESLLAVAGIYDIILD